MMSDSETSHVGSGRRCFDVTRKNFSIGVTIFTLITLEILTQKTPKIKDCNTSESLENMRLRLNGKCSILGISYENLNN